MSYKKIIVNDTNDFYAKIEEAKTQASNIFVLFTGAGSPSWCGDCNRVSIEHPYIYIDRYRQIDRYSYNLQPYNY